MAGLFLEHDVIRRGLNLEKKSLQPVKDFVTSFADLFDVCPDSKQLVTTSSGVRTEFASEQEPCSTLIRWQNQAQSLSKD